MKEKIININIVNITAIALTIITVLGFSLLFIEMTNIQSANEIKNSFSLVSFIVGLLLGFPLHELIHGLCFAIYAKKGFKSIKYGAIWKLGVLYCHCKEAFIVRELRLVLIMPAVLLGFIPVIIAFIIGNYTLLLIGSIMIGGSSGDFVTFWETLKLNKNTRIIELPHKVGFYYDDDSIEDFDLETQLKSIQINDSEKNNQSMKFNKTLIVGSIVMFLCGVLSVIALKMLGVF